MVWPPSVEVICTFFGLSPVKLLVWDCFKIRISFFRFSISLSLGFGSFLVLEVLLDGDFLRLCGRLFGFNVFSLLKSAWDSFSVFVLLNLSVVLTLALVLFVLCTTLAYVFWNPIFCLVGCGVSFVVEFCLYYKYLIFLKFLCCRECLVFASLFFMVFPTLWYSSLSAIFFKWVSVPLIFLLF